MIRNFIKYNFVIAVAIASWQVPKIEVNIKALGSEVGANLDFENDHWMSITILSKPDP